MRECVSVGEIGMSKRVWARDWTSRRSWKRMPMVSKEGARW